MNERPDAAAIAAQNAESLQTLLRALQLSAGQFSLIFARCDYLALRKQITDQLHAQCPLTIQTVTLPPTTETIFTAIQTELGNVQPEALMVFGLETVPNLERVLRATNLIREEFRKQFACPIVIWIHGGILQQLIRHAPDLENWATTIAFESSNTELIELLQQRVEDVFAQILTCREHLFLDATALNLQPDSPQGLEFQAACQAVEDRELALAPELRASLALVQGLIADNTTAVARDHYEQSLAIAQTRTPSIEQGYGQFYLGLWWGNCAARQLPQRESALVEAVEHLRAAITTFEQVNRPDLAAKFITYLAAALHRQADWEALAELIPPALELLAAHPDPFRQARIWGFQAEVALARQDMKAAQHLANQALTEITTGIAALGDGLSATDTVLVDWVQTYHRGWYLYTLGRAELQLADKAAAQQTLEQAKATTQAQYDPDLYLGILKTLRDLYFDQGDYLRAFDLKLERRTIESQFGYSAFIGAGRLQAKQRITNPSLPTVAQSTSVAQEIAASGRQQDVNRLIARMSRNDHKLTVVYGQSGVGKSSMLQAGFVPALTPQAIQARTVAIVLQQVYTNWEVVFGNCLLESLQRHALQPSLPTAPPATAEMLHQIRQVVEEQNSLVVLVFDQFEEFFFEYKDTAQRKPFYDFLKQCLDIQFVKVVLSLREDYLNYLLECNRLEQLDVIDNNILDKNILFYVGNFTPEDARSVIGQLTAETAFQLDADLIEVLVEDLAQDFGEVRPIELQVVGAQLQAEDLRTLVDYGEKGPKERLVERFLEDVVTDCGQGNEQLARLVLYLLTDENNTRPLRTRSDLELELDLELGKLDLILAVLVKSRLVFQIPSSPEDRFQLVHDYLVLFVRQQKSAETTRLIAEVEQEREKRKITEAQLERALQAQQRSLVWRLGLGAVAAGLALILPYIGTVQNNSYLRELAAKSEQSLSSNNDLESLKFALKAGRRLNKWWSLGVQNETRISVISRLQDAVYGSSLMNILEGHEGSVISTKFSSDGQYIVSGSDDGTAKVWNIKGENLVTTKVHNSAILSLEMSQDNKYIVSGGKDKLIKVWNLKGDTVSSLEGHTDAVNVLAISSNNKTLISGSENGEIIVWDLPSGEKTKKLEDQPGKITDILLDEGNKRLIVSNEYGDIILWNFDWNKNSVIEHGGFVSDILTRGKQIASLGDGSAKVWNPEGNLIREDHQVRISDVSLYRNDMDKQYVADNDRIHIANSKDVFDHFIVDEYFDVSIDPLQGHKNNITALDISSDNKVLASASTDKTIRLWNTISKFGFNERNIIRKISILPNRKVFTISQNFFSRKHEGKAHIWNLDKSKYQEVLGVSLDATGIGSRLITVKKNEVIYFLGLNGELNGFLEGHYLGDYKSGNSHLRVSEIESKDGTKNIHIFDVHKQSLILELSNKNRKTSSIMFSPYNNFFAISHEKEGIKVYDISGNEKAKIDLHNVRVKKFTFNEAETHLVVYRSDNKIQLYSIDGELSKELSGGSHSFQVYFSKNGKSIVVSERDKQSNSLSIWNTGLSEEKTIWDNKNIAVDWVQFVDDDEFLLVSGQGKTHFIEVSTGAVVSTIEDSFKSINSDARLLLNIDVDGTAKIRNRNGNLIGTFKIDAPPRERHDLSFYFSDDSTKIVVNNLFRREIQIYTIQGDYSFSIPYKDLLSSDEYEKFGSSGSRVIGKANITRLQGF